MAALSASQADSSWSAAAPYVAVLAALADVRFAAQPSAPSPILAADNAGASWRGRAQYAAMQASAADARFGVQPSAPSPILAADNAGASWRGRAQYAAMQASAAGAHWTKQSAPVVTGSQAQGWLAAGFGIPSLGVNLAPVRVTAQGWPSGNFGGGVLLPKAVPALEGARFGMARAQFNTDVGGGDAPPVQASAAGLRTGGFGLAKAALVLKVNQSAAPPGTGFGQAVARHKAHAQAFEVATSFGQAHAQVLAHAAGWSAAKFGEPVSAGIARADGWQCAKLGQPTATLVLKAQAKGVSSGNFGAPDMAYRARATSIPPSTRFGKPKRTWSTEC